MIHSGTTAMSERRALRAVLFCLAVLAQLMLPAIMLRAEAIAGELCVTSGGGTGPGPSNFDAHGKQCAHCRLHDCSPLSPPTVTPVVVDKPADFKPHVFNRAAAPPLRLLSTQPPPTGPPTA